MGCCGSRCGSPGRQSLVRFFVKRYLSQGNGNSSVFQQAVKTRLEEIKRKWESTTNFGCNCQDGIRSHTCCAVRAVVRPGWSFRSISVK